MRISAAGALLAGVGMVVLGACGGAQRGGPRVRDCADYAVAVRAPLARLARATEQADLDGGPDEGARGARRLAGALADERRALSGLAIDERELRRAHGALVDSLAEMAAALELLGDVLARRDEARREEVRRRLGSANQRWSAAVERRARGVPARLTGGQQLVELRGVGQDADELAGAREVLRHRHRRADELVGDQDGDLLELPLVLGEPRRPRLAHGGHHAGHVAGVDEQLEAPETGELRRHHVERRVAELAGVVARDAQVDRPRAQTLEGHGAAIGAREAHRAVDEALVLGEGHDPILP